MKHIKKSALSAFHLQIPPLPEQKKIAEILSGIDKRITASDNLQKYYLLLLDSVSRDSFKIEAGEIKTLGELAEFKSGRAFKSEELSEDGIKITRISNLHKPNFPYWRYNGEYNPKIVAKDGDILFSWAGVANSINVHRYRGEDSLLNQHIYNFEFDDTLIKEWSYWNLRNMLPKLRESIEGGAGQLHLAKGFIQSLPIPILSRSKMDSLSKCFQSIQTLVEAQKKTSIKLLTLKNALLSDLFSGRKRVSV
jgi:type I restriction enzyme S subunit